MPVKRAGLTGLARPAGLVLALGLVYWAGAYLGFNLGLFRGQVTPPWLSTGIAVAALLLFGRRVWPGITLGALAVNLQMGPSLPAVAGISAGSTLAPLVAAELLRWAGFHPEMDRPRDAPTLVFLGAMIPTMISATLSSRMLLLSGAISPSSFWPVWTVWWTGDAMGILMVAPFLLSLCGLPPLSRHNWRYWIELSTLLAATAMVSYIVFGTRIRILYLAFPFILLAAWRFRQQGATPAALLASIYASWAAVTESVAFRGESMLEKMVTLQIFNSTIAATAFGLASFVISWERTQTLTRQLQDQEHMASLLASQRRFLTDVSHTVGNPLGTILLNLSMLRTPTLPESQQTALRDARMEVNRLAELFARLRVLAEADEDVPLHQQPIDLCDLAADVVRACTAPARRRGISLELEATRPVEVRADPDLIRLATANLVENAIRYSPREHPVQVRVFSLSKEASVEVIDQGPGIQPERLPFIFDRFEHGPQGGSGLGLSIVRSVVERHGGAIGVESSPGRTCFQLRLPALPNPI